MYCLHAKSFNYIILATHIAMHIAKFTATVAPIYCSFDHIYVVTYNNIKASFKRNHPHDNLYLH